MFVMLAATDLHVAGLHEAERKYQSFAAKCTDHEIFFQSV